MENQNQKWVNLSFFAVSALAAYVVFALAIKIVGTYDLEARIRNIDLVLQVGSIVIGLAGFLILYRHDKANQFIHEVVAELSRVTWPTQKETSSATFIVIIMVLISGTLLGFLDFVWTRVIQLIL